MTTALIISILLLAVSARAGEEMVLLISHPQVWSAPSKDAAATKQSWEAGKRLEVAAPMHAAGEAKPGQWVRIENGAVKGWLPEAYLAPMPGPVDPKTLETIGTEAVDHYHGLAPEYVPVDLTAVGPRLEENVRPQMRRQAAEAWKSMLAAARAEGIKLYIVSAYRPWTKQQELYERRVRENGVEQQTVAKPGHSEHQLGTALDLSDGNSKALLQESFGQTKAGRWLHDNAWIYGFAISFTRHNAPKTGVAPEPWHYRYWGIEQARTRHFEALGEAEKAAK